MKTQINHKNLNSKFQNERERMPDIATYRLNQPVGPLSANEMDREGQKPTKNREHQLFF